MKSSSSSGGLSVISRDLKVIGDVITQGEIHIDGTIEGDVRGAKVTIGEHGAIIGTVLSENVRVRGLVRGNIISHDISLMETGRVHGDIAHDRISIEAGAFLDGRCHRREDAVPPSEEAALALEHNNQEKKVGDIHPISVNSRKKA